MMDGYSTRTRDDSRHPTNEKGQYHRPIGIVGRNDPCPCGSGKKFKRCHPDGLLPRSSKVALDEPCAVCGSVKQTIDLRHDLIPSWSARICRGCLKSDGAVASLIAKARPSLVPPAPPSVPSLDAATPDVRNPEV